MTHSILPDATTFFLVIFSLLGLGFKEWVDIPEQLGISDWPLTILDYGENVRKTMACHLVAMYRMMHQGLL